MSICENAALTADGWGEARAEGGGGSNDIGPIAQVVR